MFLTFLSASVPLTKTIEKLPDGTILKTPYPNVFRVTSHVEPVNNLTRARSAQSVCCPLWASRSGQGQRTCLKLPYTRPISILYSKSFFS